MNKTYTHYAPLSVYYTYSNDFLYYSYVTECIVCVSGYDPLTFLSCPFSFLIGWEFYGPNYLKC